MYNIFEAAKEPVAPNAPNVFADFLLNSGLYDRIEVKRDNIQQLINLLAGKVRIESYCTTCQEMRVFSMEAINAWRPTPKGMTEDTLADQLARIQSRIEALATPAPGQAPQRMEWYWCDVSVQHRMRVLPLSFRCSMNECHRLDFIIATDGNDLVKIGQHPSVADIAFPELKQYRKVLSQEDMREMRRAIGLHAQGIGVGSYAYLRRILERVIDKAKDLAIADAAITEAEYSPKKMAERIKMLKDYLPDILVNNPTVYGIISKGIHELSEEDCIEYFPIVKECIFMILEKWEQARKKAESEKQLGSALSRIASKM